MTTTRVVKGDTRSLNYSSHGHCQHMPGRTAIVVEHRGDWKWCKDLWSLNAYCHFRCTYACHICTAKHAGPDSLLAVLLSSINFIF